MTGANAFAAILAAWAGFAALVLAAIWRGAGGFEYPLDDVYIHLAMAREIARGGYGVNPGEPASAASSPLWPYLLTPFAESAAQRWWPLVWNIAALGIAAALFARVLNAARFGRMALPFAVLAPVALNMHVVAFSGMENMAQGAAGLGIVLGLWTYVETGRVGWLLVAGILLAPALRLESLAPALAASGVVLLLGRKPAGIALGLIALAPVAGFAAYLLSIGLDPLPNSVMAKLSDQPDGPGARLAANTASYGGRYLLGLSATVALVALAIWRRDRRRGLFGLAIAATGMAHLGFGATGWLDRYENYAVLALAAALALLLAEALMAVKSAVMALVLAGGLATYLPYLPNNMANLRAIQLQHREMARFAREAGVPVAVNDLGYVAWAGGGYVLDLWGLASKEALDIRVGDPDPGWAAALADAKGVRLAMIYDGWLGAAVGPDWVRLGALVIDDPRGAFLGGRAVAFYATDPAAETALRAGLGAWAAGLPEGARWEDGG